MTARSSETPESKATLVLGLQEGWTHNKDEEKIEDIFLSTQGLELTNLKDRIDHGNDHYDIQQLIYHDIDDTTRRQRILEHVRLQSQYVRHVNGGAIGIKVVSDIDDTIYPNFADKRPWGNKNMLYPGIVEFYEAVTGTLSSVIAKIVLISARPYERTGLLENYGTKHLLEMGFPAHTTLSGNLWTLLAYPGGLFTGPFRWLEELAIREIGRKKTKNLMQWIDLMGEYDVIISGDRTQADPDFAFEALIDPKVRDRVLAGFIHDVGDRERREHERLHYNETVLGHAIDAHSTGLIDLHSLSKVLKSVTNQRDSYPEELQRSVESDISRAREHLSD